MLSRITLTFSAILFSATIFGQTKATLPVKVAPVQAPAPAPAPKPLNFKKTSSGIEYSFIVDKPTSQKPQEGDMVRLNMISGANNRMLYNSFQVNKGKPVEFGVTKPSFKGDIIEIISMMTPGDSVVAQVDAASIYKNTKNKMPDFIKNGDKIQYFIKLVSIKTKEQMQKEQQAQIQKQFKAQMAKQEADSKKMLAKEDKQFQAIFKERNLTPTKTASGMYYSVQHMGEGESPKANDIIKMNYTGILLDGTKFDSNVDSVFGHQTPFEFKLGTGQVIKGWDEGVALLKKGSKATFFIPSPLAYGGNARPGGSANPKGIPANSPLIFDVEVLDVSTPVNEDEQLQKYFKDNNLIVNKTKTGLYYRITEDGEGPKAQTDQEVSMNYTGFLLDGTTFDSNVDSAFQHVQPFNFQLGQGRVIKGWDEGVALLSKGSKATFYIPSSLAYGNRAMPGGAANPKGIPANSILIFNVELLDILPKK